MAFDANQYGDPMLVLQAKQDREANRTAAMERVCSGCIHKRVLFVGEEKVKTCALKRGWNPTIYCNFKETANE